MILLLDTSTSVCKLSLVESDGRRHDYEWDAGRQLAKDLLKYINDKLNENGRTWPDISAVGVFKGPGSFTGLRIGITVANTIADAQDVPIKGGFDDDWQGEVISKLDLGENDKIVLPFYGSEANITQPKK